MVLPRTSGGALVAIALLGLASSSCRSVSSPSPGTGAPTSDAPLRVLSYNIHAGKDAGGVDNLARVAQLILEAGADLVLLQEVDRGTTRSGGVDQLRALAQATGLEGAFGRTLDYQGGEYGIALISRWPIRSGTLIHLPIHPPQERAGGSHEPRGMLHAVVEVPGGELHVVNTHLDASREDGYRWQEIGHLLSRVDSLRGRGLAVLFGGDLNALPDSRVVAEARARGWRDGWEECGAGEGFTFPADQPARRIDYLFMGDGLACAEARVLSSTASDHRAVLVRLVPPEAPGAAPSTQPAPGTDIWLFPLAPMGAAVAVDEGVRVTRRPGYDNQPGFLPGSEALLYTAIDETGQADIWRYDLPSRRTSPVTRTTPESEYSATVLPSGDRFSVIRVEADSTQRLWSFDLSGGDPRVILPEVRPVGYHTWLDADRLALFVLGDPPTLHVASVPEGSVREVARDIGRCLQRIPGPGTLSFVQRAESGTGFITEYDPRTGAIRALAPLLEGNEFFAWTPEGVLVMGRGSGLFRWVPGLSEEWAEVADLSPAGVGAISRVAISPDGRWVAVVVEEAG